MTRMIERWFPCAEVSQNSGTGWGSGNTERNLFTWFAQRPTAQAKAAVICSLLPWPDHPAEQKRLQDLVREAMTGRYAAWNAVRDEIIRTNSQETSVLDPFSGRGMIPLEAARLGLTSHGTDYSHVATLASHLLCAFPYRDWSNEPEIKLPIAGQGKHALGTPRLLDDLEKLFRAIGQRHRESMRQFYPCADGAGSELPWGYLWAMTLPCQECGRRFPLVGSFELRRPSVRKATATRSEFFDPGQSFYIDAEEATGEFQAVVHDGRPRATPTLTNAIDPDTGRRIPNKAAVCPFSSCGHVHPKTIHQRLAVDGHGRDVLLVVAEHDPEVSKRYREPTEADLDAVRSATKALHAEHPFTPLLPAVPDEPIAIGNSDTIRPTAYGAKTFGDLMCDRQTLSFVRLARIIAEVGGELSAQHGLSTEYARALTGYAAAQLARQLRRSTRGANLEPGPQKVHDIYVNESTIAFSHDFFEAGVGSGPGSWHSVSSSGLTTLRSLLGDIRGIPTEVMRGSATELPFRDGSITAIVTDPPYDEMIAYADGSDLLYVWLKRALFTTWPELAVTGDPLGTQEKDQEIIVKRFRAKTKTDYRDHRTREHYDTMIARAFREMRRVVNDDGVVTIVFGHGEPEVWQRLLSAIDQAGLVMTGSWPAATEPGGVHGAANIEVTLTMACRPAAPRRPDGRKAAVEAEIRSEIKARYPEWERFGLAPTDMLMAAAGPAMEAVGRYARVLDHLGREVDIATFLPIARATVQEAMAVEVDHHPLEAFDARTRFALWWTRLYGRSVVAKSELRWQVLADSLDLPDVRDLVVDADKKGVRLISSAVYRRETGPESSVIDVALSMARAYPNGLDAVGEVLVAAGRESDDLYLWAAMKFLVDRLPDSDLDAIAWTGILRNRGGVGSAASRVTAGLLTERTQRAREASQPTLF